MNWRRLEHATRPMRQRLSNLAARAKLLRVDDSIAVQRVQIEALLGEARDLLERVQQYGLTSVPLEGAHPVVLLCPQGDRTQALAIAVDDVRHRPTGGGAGDVVLYDNRGNQIRLKNGVIEIVAVADLHVQVTAQATVEAASVEVSTSEDISISISQDASVTISGDAVIACNGQIQIQSDDLQLGLGGVVRKLVDERMISTYNAHTHPNPEGGNTGAPNQQLSINTHTTTNTRGN